MGKKVNLSLVPVEERKKAFLENYRTHGVIGPACEHVGISRSLFKSWRNADPAFEEAVKEAYEQAVDEAEAELRKRAIHGTEEPVLYKGQPVWKLDPDTGDKLLDEAGNPIPLTIPRRSDRLLEVYTRTHRPAYKERSELMVVGPDGGAADLGLKIVFVQSNSDGKPLEQLNTIDGSAIEIDEFDALLALPDSQQIEDDDDWLN